MDLFVYFLIFALVLLAGCVLGLWLLIPWWRRRRNGAPFSLWVTIWGFGWASQVIGWVLYGQTYQRMDQYPKPVELSKDLICLSFLLWIVAFGLFREVKPLGILALSGLLAVIMATPLVLLQKQTTPPPDQELLVNFQCHQVAFDRLRLMAQADKGLSSVSDGWTNPENPADAGVSQARVDEYRKLFKIVGIECCSSSDHKSIDLEAWGMGSALSSDTTKGYAYLVKSPENVVNDLDQCQPEDRRFSVEVYRHVQGNWYLFYEYIPG